MIIVLLWIIIILLSSTFRCTSNYKSPQIQIAPQFITEHTNVFEEDDKKQNIDSGVENQEEETYDLFQNILQKEQRRKNYIQTHQFSPEDFQMAIRKKQEKFNRNRNSIFILHTTTPKFSILSYKARSF